MLCIFLLFGEFLDCGQDRQLFYEVHGEGAPVVLIGGVGSTSGFWDPILPELKKHHQVLVFDPKGTGKSTSDQEAITLDSMTADILRLMDHLNWKKAHIVGISLGGFIAQNLALNHAERVDKLVLMATSAGGPSHVAPGQEVIQFWSTMAMMKAEDRLAKGLALSVSDTFEADQPEVFQNCRTYFENKHAPDDVVFKQSMVGMTFNMAEQVTNISVPTLVIHGQNDRIVPIANGKALAQKIPGATLESLDTGHLIPWESPKKLSKTLTKFLN